MKNDIMINENNQSQIDFINDLVISKLSLFNIFVGANNTGKSTALRLINKSIENSTILDSLLPFEYYFYNSSNSNISEDHIQQLNFILNKMESSLSKVSISGNKIIMDKTYRNLSEGIIKLINIFITLINHRDHILIIDELENSFHHSIYKYITDLLHNICIDNNIKLCISTHNLELLDCFISDDRSSFTISLFRFIKLNGETNIIHMNKEKLKALRDVGQEIR